MSVEAIWDWPLTIPNQGYLANQKFSSQMGQKNWCFFAIDGCPTEKNMKEMVMEHFLLHWLTYNGCCGMWNSSDALLYNLF